MTRGKPILQMPCGVGFTISTKRDEGLNDETIVDRHRAAMPSHVRGPLQLVLWRPCGFGDICGTRLNPNPFLCPRTTEQ